MTAWIAVGISAALFVLTIVWRFTAWIEKKKKEWKGEGEVNKEGQLMRDDINFLFKQNRETGEKLEKMASALDRFIERFEVRLDNMQKAIDKFSERLDNHIDKEAP